MSVVQRIYIRRDSAQNWSAINPVLNSGELGFDTTNEILKVGTGSAAWNDLSQFTGPAGANGAVGADGNSAFDIAVANGFSGTEAEWLDSLKGADGADGTNGTDGDSAYNIAVTNGFTGTEAEWLESLQGADGTDGADGADGQDGQSGSSINAYVKATLPLNASAGTNALVTDGTTTNTPTMSYFYNGSWYRTFDNSQIVDQTVDVFIIAGQSNAHGWADVANGLSTAQATQDGIFYTSWHDHTSNASDLQYYSDWATSLVAGYTRGDSNESTLEGSNYFGPELGFVSQGDVINLTSGQPIGILKYAVGSSALVDNPSDPTGGVSDWDINATGDRRGDALRGFKLAVDDAVTKLNNAGYSYRIAGMIWWQQMSPTVSGTTTLMNHIRGWLDSQGYLDMQASQFPIVITKNGHDTDLTPVADADAYIGVVDAGAFGHTTSQNHVGQASHGSSDTTNSGTNDMFEIGEAYADQMQLAIAGNTNASWNPSSITTRLWVDMDDQSTFTSSGGYVTSIADKSGNNYSFSAKAGATITAVSSAQNGKNALRFDGNSDATTSSSVGFTPSARHKWFFVAKVTGSDKFDSLLIVQKGNTLRMIMQNLASDGVFPADWNVIDGGNMKGNPTNLLGQWVLLSAEFDVPNQESAAWLNGTAYNTNVAQPNLTATNFTNMTVKLCENSGSQIQDADWGELVMTEDISQANSDKIEGYLAHKWGLAADLPSSHPYKTQAP